MQDGSIAQDSGARYKVSKNCMPTGEPKLWGGGFITECLLLKDVILPGTGSDF